MKLLLGIGLVLFAVLILGGTYIPVLKQEISYKLGKYSLTQDIKEVEPVDTSFGILIPKIGANSRIIKNVDPYSSNEYQVALTKGVAHARGSSFPGEPGNIFLFSHSSTDFLNATKYNSIFYLLTKLEKDDSIRLYYQGKEYEYLVKVKKTVDPDAIEYLKGSSEAETLTLMTCWPPGTSIKRLIIQAVPKHL